MSVKLDLRNKKVITKRLFKAVHDIFGEKAYILMAGAQQLIQT